MKNKLALLYFALMSLPFSVAEAQKVKSQTVESTSIHYPIVALPESFTTYQVLSKNEGIDLKEFSKITNLEDRVQLQSFKRETQLADLNVKIILGGLKLFPMASEKQIKSLDELKGQSAETMLEYTLMLAYEVTDRAGIVVQKETFIRGRTFDSETPVTLPRRQSKAVDIVKSVTDFTNVGADAIAARVKDLFDTYREKYPMEFYTIKASKTDPYEEFTTAVQKLEEAFRTAKDETTLQNSIKPSIEFWESKLKTFDVAKEDEVPYYFLCSYNLAAAFCSLDDFDKSIEYLEKTKASNYKSGYAGLLSNQILKRKKIKDQYILDKTTVAQTPETIYQKSQPQKSVPGSIFELGKKPAAQPDFMEKGFIILPSYDTLFGSFIEFDTNLNNGKILFVQQGQGKIEYAAPYEKIQRLSIRGLFYYPDFRKGLRKVSYTSPSLVVLTNEVEVLFIFPVQDKHNLYTLFDSEDGAAYVTNYKKKLAEVFAGICPFVQEKALKGGYELKKEGIEFIEAVAKDFESQCGSREYDKFRLMLDQKVIQGIYK